MIRVREVALACVLTAAGVVAGAAIVLRHLDHPALAEAVRPR